MSVWAVRVQEGSAFARFRAERAERGEVNDLEAFSRLTESQKRMHQFAAQVRIKTGPTRPLQPSHLRTFRLLKREKQRKKKKKKKEKKTFFFLPLSFFFLEISSRVVGVTLLPLALLVCPV